MRYRLVVHWPSKDILPEAEDLESAAAAVNRCRKLKKLGLHVSAIYACVDGEKVPISQYKLRQLYQGECSQARQLLRQGRHTVASVLLGILASALPNGFGDFGILSGNSVLAVARIFRNGGSAKGRRRIGSFVIETPITTTPRPRHG